KLSILNGGAIGTSATENTSGNGGNITLNITESLDISGKSNSGNSSLLAVRTKENSTGNAGILTVNSPIINITDEGKITAEGLGSGNAGILNINANVLNLKNKGLITASTTSGEGGNINLNLNNYLLMRNQSLITATAGGSGNGGNININAPFLIAIDTENSDIFANAFKGRGGNINITTNGIYGLQFRDKPSNLSDITASSEFGLNGTVQINTPGIDPAQGLIELSGKIVDISVLVEKGCNSRSARNNNRFIYTGRNGLPNNPVNPIDNQFILADLGEKISTKQNIIPKNNISQSEHKSPQLIESQGWIINSKGEIVLTANNPNVTPHNSGFKSLNCGN
ncbi:MAG TPA: S-layer family protein, partial [Allocoleopsis sp.]